VIKSCFAHEWQQSRGTEGRCIHAAGVGILRHSVCSIEIVVFRCHRSVSQENLRCRFMSRVFGNTSV